MTPRREDTTPSPASALVASCLFWLLLAVGLGMVMVGLLMARGLMP